MKSVNHLKWQDSGKGPVVVLLHDVLLTPESWSSQVDELLNADFRVIVPDLSSFSQGAGISGYGTDLMRLLDWLGVGRFAVCGLGLGGSIIFDLLERYQRRIAGVCLINSRSGSDDVQEKLKRAQVIQALAEENDVPARDELLKMLINGREQQLGGSMALKIVKSAYNYDKGALVGLLRAMQERKNYTALLNSINLPVLILSGQDDTICHPGYSEMMAKQLPNCFDSVCLSGGHLIQLEQANVVSTQLKNFLGKIVPQRHPFFSQYSQKAA